MTTRLGTFLCIGFMVVGCASKKTVTQIPLAPQKEVVVSGPSELQIKYGELLDVVPESIKNEKLYAFIDGWMGTPYRLGGETTEGIDCSSFTQLLYGKVYEVYIERTAHKQFVSNELSRFRGQEYLEEGDLLFFQHRVNGDSYIDHVGIYLGNYKFVHSTANRDKSTNKNGVQISDIRNRYWDNLFVAAGKRKDIHKSSSSTVQN